MSEISLQDRYFSRGICFGCGPANEYGLQIKSFVMNDEVVAHWHPKPHHQAFPGVLNGGIIGALLDCHSNCTAAWYLMKKNNRDTPPCTVTAEYSIKLLLPTPSDEELKLIAKVVDATEKRATVEAQLIAKDKICATCKGIFVAVNPGHPAYHRW